MAFDLAEPNIPAGIGEIRIIIIDADGTIPGMGIQYSLIVLDADGDQMHYPRSVGNLEPHLTAAQKTALVDFMADLRALAVAEIIPTP